MVSASLIVAPASCFARPLQGPLKSPSRTGATSRIQRRPFTSRDLSKHICKICALSSRWQEATPQKKRAASRRNPTSHAVTAQSWDRATSRCVEISTVAFLFLVMPQVIKNHISMTSGHAEALAVLSWVVSTAESDAQHADNPEYVSDHPHPDCRGI